MIEKTQAVVLKSFSYKESSSIAVLYTENFGLKSYIIKGGRSKKSTVRSSLFQPLQLIEIVFYNNKNTTLNTIKECHINRNLSGVYTDIVKNCLFFFIVEVLNLSLKDGNPNSDVFYFIKECIETIDDSDDKHLKDFHIYFMNRFSSLLGFQPLDNYSSNDRFFDINAGRFIATDDIQTLTETSSLLLHRYLTESGSSYRPFTENSIQRADLLNTYILFFEQHITSQRKIKSHQILHTVL